MAPSLSRFLTLFVLALGFGAGPAFAQSSIGSVADGIVNQGTFTSILDLFSGLCFVIGLTFGIKSTLQLKDYTNNPGQTKLSAPIVSMIICGLLMSIPSLFEALQTTFALTGSQLGGFATMSAGSPTEARDLSGMFQALATSVPALAKLVSFGAICAGAFMILRAVLMLPHVSQGREPAPKMIWLMISGIGLWALLPLITASMTTIGAANTDASNILTAKYAQVSGGGFDGTIAAVLVFVQLIGLIAFVRGVLILKSLGENKDGAMGRALTHIVGGSAAMNAAWTVKMLAGTIGAAGVVCGLSTNLCS